MILRNLYIRALAGVAVALIPAVASDHVIVTPQQAGIGQELTFNVSVPDERTTAVTNLRLLIPSGVGDVTPTEKAGWTIQTKTGGSDSHITEIDWSGASIPVGERDDFSFSAQVPSSATTLDWKAYQTYADGTTVHWDQTPVGDEDDATGNAGPYSRTQIVNDLNANTTPTSSSQDNLALGLAVVAILLSVVSLLRKPKAPR